MTRKYWIANERGLLPHEDYETERDAKRHLGQGEYIVEVNLNFTMPEKTVTLTKSHLEEFAKSAGLEPDSIAIKNLIERVGL